MCTCASSEKLIKFNLKNARNSCVCTIKILNYCNCSYFVCYTHFTLFFYMIWARQNITIKLTRSESFKQIPIFQSFTKIFTLMFNFKFRLQILWPRLQNTLDAHTHTHTLSMTYIETFVNIFGINISDSFLQKLTFFIKSFFFFKKNQYFSMFPSLYGFAKKNAVATPHMRFFLVVYIFTFFYFYCQVRYM